MKKIILTLFSVIVVGVVFLAPKEVVLADGFVTCSGPDCSFCNLVSMANTVIKWLFGVIVMIFVFLMVVSGFGLVTSGGNQSELESAKSKFTNAIIGVLIVASAWLLVDTIMKVLLDSGSGSEGTLDHMSTGWGPWHNIECSEQVTLHDFSRNGSDTSLVNDDPSLPPPPPPVSPPAGPGQYTHEEALAALSVANISVVSSGNCTDKTKKTCTSLDGVQKNSIQRLIEFQQAYGSPIIITGGTEVGHAAGTYSHSNGYKIDLKQTTSLNEYIKSNFTDIGGNKYRDSNGNIFYYHNPPHWDIQFRY